MMRLLSSKTSWGRRLLCAPLAALALAVPLTGSYALVPENKMKAPLSCSGKDSEATTLTLLGTAAGPVARKLRSQPANLLTIGGKHYLIDAGDGTARQLAKVGVMPHNIKQVFLSHLHGDHIIGLGPLMMFQWTALTESAVTIHGPPGTKMFVEGSKDYISVPVAIFRPQYPAAPQLDKKFSAVEHVVSPGMQPTLIHADDKVKVWAVENTHYVSLPPLNHLYGRDRSYSYRFDTPDRSIVFTGDTGPSEALSALASGADVLVSEVIDIDKQIDVIRRISGLPDEKIQGIIEHMAKHHLTAEQVGRIADAASVKHVVLTHLAPGMDEEIDFSSYTKGVEKHFSGPISIGKDLDCF